MGTSHPRNMRRLKGRLVLGPTDLTTTFPYGGTELGLCRSASFVFGIKYAPIQAEEFGGNAVEWVYQTESAVLSAVLREYDDDMVSSLFINGERGFETDGTKTTASGKPVIKGDIQGAIKPGGVVTAKIIKLLFAPDDEDHHEFLVMYNALPMIEEASQMKLTAADWAEIGVVFHAVPDSAGKLYQFGRKTDISLT